MRTIHTLPLFMALAMCMVSPSSVKADTAHKDGGDSSAHAAHHAHSADAPADRAPRVVVIPANAGQKGQKIRLLFVNVPPDPQGDLISVYLQTSDGRRVDSGLMSFFGVEHSAGHSQHGDGHGSATKSFNFDVTRQVEALKALPGDKLYVTLERAEDSPFKTSSKTPYDLPYERVEIFVE